MIARAASAHQVVPCVPATAVPRHHVVERQLLGLRAAVLAGVVVAQKDLAPREPDAGARTLHELYQADHRRARDRKRGRADGASTVLQDLSLPTVEEDHGAPGVADVDRLIVLIKHQY